MIKTIRSTGYFRALVTSLVVVGATFAAPPREAAADKYNAMYGNDGNIYCAGDCWNTCCIVATPDKDT